MSLLLDTHIPIRLLEDESLSPLDSDVSLKSQQLFISVASLWEMAIKISLKKLSISGSYDDIFETLERTGIQVLSIDKAVLTKALNLPWIHKDPFDRLIIAQSIINNNNYR
jgi:PIN domain nuclease of toxin-antitoxin system